ncbi:myogenesis-regulating glycosidase-like [Toxorhynchites rutilus septentrionalis]|uniref:myogenesis-regulating glycosidase-like n=1 Tax=Toxorhynchites rutilus septentrionalis TaxID=329112 RepID=UPI00247ACD64|nr:myogenesis-regulating glycosidase-like [Toxorhynchites rutilus septentrionalis]
MEKHKFRHTLGVLLVLVSVAIAADYELKFDTANVTAMINTTTGELTVVRNGMAFQRILMGQDLKTMQSSVEIANGFKLRNADGEEIEFTKDVDESEFSLFTVARKVRHRSKMVVDCVRIAGSNWYGGPQQKYQYWPIQKLRFNEYSFISKEADNCAVADRYWLNSLGSFVYVDDQAPLFIDQNYGEPGYMCLEVKKSLPYDIHDNTYSFIYKIGISSDAKKAHMAAVTHILGKPTGHPAEEMVKYSVWSTWARYKRDINQTVVLKFADEIIQHGWKNGQYELDDDWEVCYGALKFNTKKFPNIKQTVDSIRAKGFPRVTLWIHPFVNKGCEPVYSEAKRYGYFVADHNGNPDTQWWNSMKGEAAYIDFTKPEVAQWFTRRLQAILDESGIDSFKFDAGESSWSPPDALLNGPRAQHPYLIVEDYLRAVAMFGDLVEVRSAHSTQDLPIFVRMIDKDSEWNWNNGLPTLITTLLQMNMVGYPLVLPDMVGGNGYDDHPPNKEMFIRWLQANVFMPSIQFSYVPWDYDSETVQISKAMTDLHEKYTPSIMERFKLAVSRGDPVNPPLWWISPNDTEAQKIYDQFLLGEDIIAAPVIRENSRARDIYLPAGSWEDGNTKTVHTGPKWIRNYPAPLSMLPYFVRKTTLN